MKWVGRIQTCLLAEDRRNSCCARRSTKGNLHSPYFKEPEVFFFAGTALSVFSRNRRPALNLCTTRDERVRPNVRNPQTMFVTYATQNTIFFLKRASQLSRFGSDFWRAGRTAIAPVLKTGARKGFEVRILGSPHLPDKFIEFSPPQVRGSEPEAHPLDESSRRPLAENPRALRISQWSCPDQSPLPPQSGFSYLSLRDESIPHSDNKKKHSFLCHARYCSGSYR